MRESTSRRQRTVERAPRSARGLTCANCRMRKTRCDGTQPCCKTCEVYKDDCRYEKPPPMSQIVAMAKRLQELEQAKEDLEKKLEEARLPERDGSSGIPMPPPISSSLASPSYSTQACSVISGRDVSPSSASSVHEELLLSELSLDEHGKLCYHGPTSAVHAPLSSSQKSAASPRYEDEPLKLQARSMLTSSALEASAWEDFALDNATLQSSIPRHTVSTLVRIFWTWVAPTFMWVYRPAFIRDMALGGVYFSPFLLTVICAHAARFDSAKLSDMLISRARLLLGSEIQRPSSIPTVQALLQLSARDLAYGSISQAWLYSGMAFRMVSDLGLQHSNGNMASIGDMSAEDIEIRRRLFWSCYFWDKAISLFLGRMPVLLDLPTSQFPDLLDDSAENDEWRPDCGGAINLSKMPASEYPPMKAHLITCFQNSCKLAIIINDIIIALYSRRSSSVNVGAKLLDIRSRLTKWRDDSPAHLKYDPDDLPDVCPPPHIICQNLLYHTAVILLHRPFYGSASHRTTCRRAANDVEKLLILYEKTFSFSRVTYIMAYCIYTAASVITQDVKANDAEAAAKMQTFLRALRQGTATCPVLQRSLDIITRSLRPDSAATTTNVASGALARDGSMPFCYLPAFPYGDVQAAEQGDLNLASAELDGMAYLQSFPEHYFDGLGATVGGWTMNGGVI